MEFDEMNEPAWIEHDGSAVCPVPAGHDVEVRLRSGTIPIRMLAGDYAWNDIGCPADITHYRDWTAFKQQEAMSNDVPNPPAFPVAPILPDIREGGDGMSLRDWFAGQALAQSIEIVRNGGNNRPDVLLNDLVRCAGLIAYDFADAMLAARNNIDSLAAAGE